MASKTLLPVPAPSGPSVVSDDDRNYEIRVTPSFDADKPYRCMFCTLIIAPTGRPMGCPVRLIESSTERRPGAKHADRTFVKQFCVDGVFCSYNCAKAFAASNAHDPLYRNSDRYLALMLCHEIGERVLPIVIKPSPSPRLLLCYGGTMTEDQYREEAASGRYVYKGRAAMFPLTTVFERKTS